VSGRTAPLRTTPALLTDRDGPVRFRRAAAKAESTRRAIGDNVGMNRIHPSSIRRSRDTLPSGDEALRLRHFSAWLEGGSRLPLEPNDLNRSVLCNYSTRRPQTQRQLCPSSASAFANGRANAGAAACDQLREPRQSHAFRAASASRFILRASCDIPPPVGRRHVDLAW
jgi:hypothetical protein